jgi:hypothetical protein
LISDFGTPAYDIVLNKFYGMRIYRLIWLFLLVLPSCISEDANSFQVRKQLISAERRITKSYINYLHAIDSSGIPLLSYQYTADQNNKSIFTQRFQTDKNLQYLPATLWQLSAFDGKYKYLAENISDIIHKSHLTYEPGNAELIRNAFLTPYIITGDHRHYKIFIESLNQQISASEAEVELASDSDSLPEIDIEKLLENEFLFFASQQTGDPYYQELALEQSDQIYHCHFQSKLSNELFYGVTNWNTPPQIEELEKLGSYDFYKLSMSFYGFAILFNETGDQKYGSSAVRLARLFTNIFEGDNLKIKENLDLTSRSLICLAMSWMSDGSEINYKETSERIFKSILADLDLWPSVEDPQYSFRMYYYLFECLKQE